MNALPEVRDYAAQRSGETTLDGLLSAALPILLRA